MINIYSILFLPAMLFLRFLLSLTIGGFPAKGVSWTEAVTKWHHPTQKLDDIRMQNLVNVLNGHFDHFNSTLDNILIPRVPGTPGHENVHQYIVNEMKSQGWSVEEDSFNDNTPHGRKPFSNIIATLNPKACRRLVISCHYDSLYNREYTFMGATDSAVPCTMMIHIARILNQQLREQKNKNNDLTLQFVFFDGEEAFHKWSRTDSLYGSRHLAALWNNKPFPNGNDGKHCQDRADYASYLDRMDVLVLLDLIGTANPKFYSYFPDTHGLYSQLIEIEQRLNNLKLLETHPPESTTQYFDRRSSLAFVEDDHIPFMKKGVPIVHLIPSPFPHVWHKESDNRNNLHHPTIHNLNKILLIFISQYLHLDITQEPIVM